MHTKPKSMFMFDETPVRLEIYWMPVSSWIPNAKCRSNVKQKAKMIPNRSHCVCVCALAVDFVKLKSVKCMNVRWLTKLGESPFLVLIVSYSWAFQFSSFAFRICRRVKSKYPFFAQRFESMEFFDLLFEKPRNYYHKNDERISVSLLFENVYDMKSEDKLQLSQHNGKNYMYCCLLANENNEH